MIVYLLLVWIKFKSKVGWGLQEFTRLAQTMLLERCDLWGRLNPTAKAPPPQLFLFPLEVVV